MIPVGWMAPLCIVCGNTFVLKPASTTPMTCLKFAELYKEAGFPDGVLNIVPCSRNEAELLMSHPDIKGISFVGSTSRGPACVPDGCGQRQARSGPVRSQEPCAGAA